MDPCFQEPSWSSQSLPSGESLTLLTPLSQLQRLTNTSLVIATEPDNDLEPLQQTSLSNTNPKLSITTLLLVLTDLSKIPFATWMKSCPNQARSFYFQKLHLWQLWFGLRDKFWSKSASMSLEKLGTLMYSTTSLRSGRVALQQLFANCQFILCSTKKNYCSIKNLAKLLQESSLVALGGTRSSRTATHWPLKVDRIFWEWRAELKHEKIGMTSTKCKEQHQYLPRATSRYSIYIKRVMNAREFGSHSTVSASIELRLRSDAEG